MMCVLWKAVRNMLKGPGTPCTTVSGSSNPPFLENVGLHAMKYANFVFSSPAKENVVSHANTVSKNRILLDRREHLRL